MKVRKIVFTNILIFCCSFYSATLFSQEALPESHWTMGLDLGVNVYKSHHDYNNEGLTSKFLSGSTNLHYRIIRWLGLTANLGYIQQHTHYHDVLWDVGNREGILVNKDLSINMFAFSLGPHVLLRIGQGDLGLKIGYGWMLSSPRVNAITSEGKAFDVKYKGEFERYFSYDLAYTYWPKPRIGIKVGVEVIGDNDPSEGGYQAKTNFEKVYPGENTVQLSQLAPPVDGPELINITLGIAYRFK